MGLVRSRYVVTCNVTVSGVVKDGILVTVNGGHSTSTLSQ